MARFLTASCSIQNLIDNYELIKTLVRPAKVIAMVKANAYGHGLVSVGKHLAQVADMFGVASVEEALELRRAGVKQPIILMYGVYEQSELLVAAQHNLDVVFHNWEQIEWLEDVVITPRVFAWLKVDTGLGRSGFAMDEFSDAYDQLRNNKKTDFFVRILSHFACSSDVSHLMNQQQIELMNVLPRAVVTEFSFCNSAAIFNFPNMHVDYVRPGLALYGVSPVKGKSAQELGLKPVMTLYSSLVAVRTMKKGDSIGYGATYVCQQNMKIGIVSCGYADGYPASYRPGMFVLVNDRVCPVVGPVCMDLLVIDLSQVPHPSVGDLVMLWGAELSVETVASYSYTSSYAILAGMHNRVHYEWK